MIMVILFFSCTPPQSNVQDNKIAPLWLEGNAKWYKPAKQSNPDMDFYDFIKGVNSIEIFYDNKKYFEEQNKGIKDIAYAVQRYLYDIGFEYVNVGSKENKFQYDNPFLCYVFLH